jgi:predicted glycoside hydrolase/deacetylase ChbG (UPF0249 family)
MSSAATTLIVNADDFGLAHGVNRGILAAHQHGIVTSTSLMVRQPAAQEAIAQARAFPELSIGLHVDIAEWECRDGEWTRAYQVVELDDEEALAREVAHQFDCFKTLTGRTPTHIDSHQHVHRHEPLQALLLERARALDVPLREVYGKVRYEGSFYGQDEQGTGYPELIDESALVRILERLGPGRTELACHPGFADADVRSYRAEREVELEALCSDVVARRVSELGIELLAF